jgi:hypothetical protein
MELIHYFTYRVRSYSLHLLGYHAHIFGPIVSAAPESVPFVPHRADPIHNIYAIRERPDIPL